MERVKKLLDEGYLTIGFRALTGTGILDAKKMVKSLVRSIKKILMIIEDGKSIDFEFKHR